MTSPTPTPFATGVADALLPKGTPEMSFGGRLRSIVASAMRVLTLFFLAFTVGVDAPRIRELPNHQRALVVAFYGLSVVVMTTYVVFDVLLMFTPVVTIDWVLRERGYLPSALVWRGATAVTWMASWILALHMVCGPVGGDPNMFITTMMAWGWIITLPSGMWYTFRFMMTLATAGVFSPTTSEEPSFNLENLPV